ncbi:MAG: TAXI family TRAP transporter solute-binding subunit [Sandaracinus sp.]
MRDWLVTFQRSERGLLVGGLVALLVALFALAIASRTPRHHLRITAGDERGHRTVIARHLEELAARRGLELEIVATQGSLDAMSRVADRSLDAALVQGGLDAPDTVREVAPVALEPLHVLARGEIWDLDDVRGTRVQLSPPGSGTRIVAIDVLSLVGLCDDDGAHPSFTEVEHTYAELESLDDAEMPDVIFHVSTLPSPVAERLIARRGYHLLPVPLAGAVHLHNVAVLASEIPAYAYGASPPMPREPLPTLATRMLVVAHQSTDEEAIRLLLETLDSEAFARAANLSRVERQPLWDEAEMPLHRGTQAWLRRDQPLLTPELMEGLESLRSFLVSVVVAAFLLYRWYRTRKLHGLDGFLAEVSAIDRDVLAAERAPNLELQALLDLRVRLGEVKNRALESFAKGSIHSEELLSSFLTHVSDVRSHLNAMILSERERLQKKARTRDASEEEKVMRELWKDALVVHEGRPDVPSDSEDDHAGGARKDRD